MSEKNDVIKHDWGYELVWGPQQNCAGKILVFEKQDGKTSMHFHSVTEKTWFVNSGEFSLRFMDTEKAAVHERQLQEGDVYNVKPLQPVQLICKKAGGSITEVSDSNDPYKDIFHIGA